jgi:hypothetical protein
MNLPEMENNLPQARGRLSASLISISTKVRKKRLEKMLKN